VRIWVLRHGRTTYNDERRYQGRLDIPLSPAGEAELLPAALEPAQVFVSPLRRTQQTARRIFPNAAQRIVSDFAEMDFGDFDGRTADEMVNDAAYRAWVDSGCLTQCPNGESRAMFCARVCAAFETVMEDNLTCKAETLVIVAHGGTVRAIMERYALPEQDYYAWTPDNAGGWELDFDETLWRGKKRLRMTAPLSFRREEETC